MKNILQIRDRLLKSRSLATAAKVNDMKTFKIPLYRAGTDAIVDCYEQNQSFYQLLLDDNAAAKAVLDAILRNVYNSLRTENKR